MPMSHLTLSGARQTRMQTPSSPPSPPRILSATDAAAPGASDLLYKDDPIGWQMVVRMDMPDQLTPDNVCIGTEDYCAPELTLGALVDPMDLFATDVYSLGVLLFAALTNRFPQQPPFVQFLIETRHRLQRAWAGRDPRAALADPRLAAEINQRGAIAMDQLPLRLSPQVRDLLARMLRPLPAERITLREVCMHPWVTSQARAHRPPRTAPATATSTGRR